MSEDPKDQTNEAPEEDVVPMTDDEARDEQAEAAEQDADIAAEDADDAAELEDADGEAEQGDAGDDADAEDAAPADGADDKPADDADEPADAAPARRPKRSVRRRAERAADEPPVQGKPRRHGLPTQAWVAISVVCLVVGLVVGTIFIGGGLRPAGTTSLAESDLDRVVATVGYDGRTYDITARDAIEASSTLDAMRNDDGTYRLPTAEGAIAAARNQVIKAEVEKAGITVTQDEVDAYAQELLGTSDYASIAEQYGMDEDSVRELMSSSAAARKLYDSIVDVSDVTAPTAPEAPAEGAEDTPNATYGAYIVGLLGDEWDADKDTWARTDGPYYESLGSEDFTAESATYAQAQAAYNVAYNQYVSNYSAAAQKWTDFYNGCMANAKVDLAMLSA